MPVEHLYDAHGHIHARRERWLSKADVRDLLRRSPVDFHIAEVGTPLRRVEVAEGYEFWKSEVEAHIVDDAGSGFRLEDFPGEYAYIASEWSGEIRTPIVLLEKHH